VRQFMTCVLVGTTGIETVENSCFAL